MSQIITRPALSTLIASAALGLSGFALTPGAAAATIYACVPKGGGSVRVVSRHARCRRGETKLSWNSQGPEGPDGPHGPTGTPGATGSVGLQGAPGPGARVATLDTASSNATVQPLFTYGGDTVGVACGRGGSPSWGSFEVTGDNLEVFGSATLAYYEASPTPSIFTLPTFVFIAPGSGYTTMVGSSFTTKAGYYGVASSQLTMLESGPGALDLHVDLGLEVKDVSESLSDCKFAAMYYPVATG